MKRFIQSLASIAILTIIFGTIYVTSQQVTRSSANDPQIQLAEDTATALDQGATPASLVKGSVNMAGSLAPFVVIYDLSGAPVASNFQLGNTAPRVPIGVLETARGRSYNAVTWQPLPKVRIASVSVAAQNYYVLSGRSLTEVEKREGNLLALAAIGWAACIMIFIGVMIVLEFLGVSRKKRVKS
jgi:hypothetical protein